MPARTNRRRLAALRRVRRTRIGPVLERLADRYGDPVWSGQRLDPVAELVLTVLAQNTADVNSHRAFVALLAAYPSWDAVLAAPTDELADVIRPGGLAPTKSRRIQLVLAEVHDATNGTWDLGFLGEWPLDDAREWLVGLPGIGRKTASIVLLFAFGRPALPVDTHVYRVAARLGLLPPKTNLTRAHDLLEEVVAAGPDVRRPRPAHPPRAGGVPRSAAHLRALSAYRPVPVLRPGPEGQGQDGAHPPLPGAPGPLPRRAAPRLGRAHGRG